MACCKGLPPQPTELLVNPPTLPPCTRHYHPLNRRIYIQVTRLIFLFSRYMIIYFQIRAAWLIVLKTKVHSNNAFSLKFMLRLHLILGLFHIVQQRRADTRSPNRRTGEGSVCTILSFDGNSIREMMTYFNHKWNSNIARIVYDLNVNAYGVCVKCWRNIHHFVSCTTMKAREKST